MCFGAWTLMGASLIGDNFISTNSEISLLRCSLIGELIKTVFDDQSLTDSHAIATIRHPSIFNTTYLMKEAFHFAASLA